MQEAGLLTIAACVLAALVVFDVREKRLPDSLNAAFAVLGVVLHVSHGDLGVYAWDILLGAVLGAGLLYAVRAYFLWRTGREGLGLGDVKYIAAAGLWVGLEGIFLVIGLGGGADATDGSGGPLAAGLENPDRLCNAFAFRPRLDCRDCCHFLCSILLSVIVKIDSLASSFL